MRPIKSLILFVFKSLAVLVKYTIVLGVLLFASLLLSGHLSQRYMDAYRDVYVLPRTEASGFANWQSRVSNAIVVSEQGASMRDFMFIFTYPCVRKDFAEVESQLQQVNGELLDLLDRTDGLPGWDDTWMEREEDGLLMAPPDGAVALASPGLDETEDYQLFSKYLNWKANRDDLGQRIARLMPEVGDQKTVFLLTLAKAWSGLSAFTGNAVDLFSKGWSWGMEKIQSI